MNKITPQMIASFNEMMQDQESIIRIYKAGGNDYAYDIQTLKDRFIRDESMIYPTKEYYEMLENYFKSYGIDLSFNTIFWSI